MPSEYQVDTNTSMKMLRLLLIEDDEDFANSIVARLAKRQFIVTAKSFAEDGLSAVQEQSFDIIVTDLKLRGMSGVEFLQKLRELQYDIPVVMLTGYASLDSAKEAVRLSASDYLLKPLDDIDVLISAVNRAVEKHRLVDDNRKLNETLQLKVEELKAASDVKDQFLANMSHEIRTPLNAAFGYLDLLQETSLDDIQREYVGVIKNSTHELLGLLDNILNMARMGAFSLQAQKTRCALMPIISESVGMFKAKAKEKQLRVLIDYAPEVKETVLTDGQLVRRILNNLLENAIKFTEHGEIKVRVFSASNPLNNMPLVCIAVEDSGCGIPEDKREQIFEPFIQVDMSDTRKYGGAGLGLSLCRSYVTLLGGQIWMESKTGGSGSVFFFTLPVA